MNFIFHEFIHFVLFAVVATVFYYKYKSVTSVLMVFVGAVLIDVDHLIDYFLYSGFVIDPATMLSGSYFDASGKVMVLFHSWELVLVLILIGYFTKKGYIFYALAVGMITHLLWDQYTYVTNPFAYLVVYRVINNFSLVSFHK